MPGSEEVPCNYFKLWEKYPVAGIGIKGLESYLYRKLLKMKKILQLAFILLLATTIKAQTHYSCDTKQVCNWNATTKAFDDCGTKDEYSCMFTMNADESIFNHTTPTMKSAYYVQSKSYDAATQGTLYEVTSDVGNKYTFIINMTSKMVGILSSGKANATDYLIKFTIKSSWKD